MPSQSSHRVSRPLGPTGRGVFARLVSGLWLVLYLAIVAGAPVADGFVEHGDQVVLHVEDADGGHCPASHTSDACDICQLAHGLRMVASSASFELSRVADRAGEAAGARGIAPVALHFLDGRSSRAPPLG